MDNFRQKTLEALSNPRRGDVFSDMGFNIYVVNVIFGYVYYNTSRNDGIVSMTTEEWEKRWLYGYPRFNEDRGNIELERTPWVVLTDRGIAEQDEKTRILLAEAWNQGEQAGRENQLFEDRGLSTDPDAHQFPIKNPYRE